MHTFALLGENAINYLKELWLNENLVSFIFKVIVGLFITAIGFLNIYHMAWIVFMVADFATGMARSKKLKQWNSKKSYCCYK